MADDSPPCSFDPGFYEMRQLPGGRWEALCMECDRWRPLADLEPEIGTYICAACAGFDGAPVLLCGPLVCEPECTGWKECLRAGEELHEEEQRAGEMARRAIVPIQVGRILAARRRKRGGKG